MEVQETSRKKFKHEIVSNLYQGNYEYFDKIDDKNILKRCYSLAVERNVTPLINYFIEKRKITTNYTIIQFILNDRFDLLKLCIENGASIHFNQDLPIKYTIKYNKIEMFKYLLDEHVSVRTQKSVLLRLAVDYDRTEAVKLLLDKGIQIHTKKHYCIRKAFQNKNLEMIQLLQHGYLKRFGKLFVCYNCISLPHCTNPCTKEFVKNFNIKPQPESNRKEDQ